MGKAKKLMLFAFLLGIVLMPFAVYSIPALHEGVEHWWCKGCGLAYPASTKTCLNKDCPYYKQPRKR